MAETGRRERERDAVRDPWQRATGRRGFLRVAGATVALSAAAACDDITGNDDDDRARGVTLDFSSPVGILNYAYALEQLEAAFYTRVVQTPFAEINDEEGRILTDLRDHEIAHREFYNTKIRQLGGNPITRLSFDFSPVDFASRQSVLQTALDFENLGVWAYNGVARFIDLVPALLNAGEIVSVEARHASTLADLLGLGFAVDAFDQALVPSAVLPMIDEFIVNRLNVRNLPAGA